MHTVRTKSLHQYNHPEIEIIVDLKKVPKQYLLDFINHLQSLVADGNTFTPGDTMQYGTYHIQVTASDNDYIRLDEPNNKGLPITYKPGVSHTLETALSQITFLEGYAIPADQLTPASMLQSTFVCNTYKESSNLALSRLAPIDENDSGWFIANMDSDTDLNDPNNLDLVSLYEALCHHPQLRPWLGFPVNTIIELTNDNVQVSINDTLQEVQPDSPLAQSLEDSP